MRDLPNVLSTRTRIPVCALLQTRLQQEANQVGPLVAKREALEAQVEQLRAELVQRDEAQVRTLLDNLIIDQ